MKTETRVATETNYYIAYKLHGITYIPHYKKDTFVSPNYSSHEGLFDEDGDKLYFPDTNKEYTAHQLEKAGATKVSELLWIRGKHKPLK